MTDDLATKPATHDDERKEWLREAVTMALYVSLSLLAVLVALPPGSSLGNDRHLALTILITAVALLLAHQVAFRLSTRRPPPAQCAGRRRPDHRRGGCGAGGPLRGAGAASD
jgi:peptidoglycan/LPS O-acetylase OafA/YrhL